MIKTIKLESAGARAGVIALAVLSLIVLFFFVKWFFANTIAGRAVSLPERNREVADLALALAPGDPRTHLISAILYDKSFLPEDLPKSLAEYEQAAALSPHDYRLWSELGRARERSGDTDGAESALRRALALAPNYAQVQWTLGNFLLRQGKSEEAFAQIRRAAEGEKNFANPAVASAWQMFGGDIAAMKQYAGDSPNLRAALAALLAREKRFDEAAELWLSLPEAARRSDFKASGEEIYQKMIEAKKYRAAMRLWTDFAVPGAEAPAVGRISNGGFEAETPVKAGLFDWQIADGIEPRIGRDRQKHGGEYSLVIVFAQGDGKEFRPVSQTVPVEAGKRYEFEVFYRADLRATATLRWEIVDAADGQALAATEPVAAKSEWAGLKAGFVAPANAEAVTLRLARADCSSGLCPIAGRVWFDDFALAAR